MSEALKLAEEAKRMMIDFAEEVWQAGKDGFRCDSIASCRESRCRAESAIEALASQAESEARDAARWRTLRHSLSGEAGCSHTKMPSITDPFNSMLTYLPHSLDQTLDAIIAERGAPLAEKEQTR